MDKIQWKQLPLHIEEDMQEIENVANHVGAG